MIDFACKQFNIEDIIKCGLGLTRREYDVMKHFLEDVSKECTAASAAKKLDLNLTTVQKAVKKLHEKGVLIRHQENLDKGGYIYTYESNSKRNIRDILKKIIRNWSSEVEKKMDHW